MNAYPQREEAEEGEMLFKTAVWKQRVMKEREHRNEAQKTSFVDKMVKTMTRGGPSFVSCGILVKLLLGA